MVGGKFVAPYALHAPSARKERISFAKGRAQMSDFDCIAQTPTTHHFNWRAADAADPRVWQGKVRVEVACSASRNHFTQVFACGNPAIRGDTRPRTGGFASLSLESFALDDAFSLTAQ